MVIISTRPVALIIQAVSAPSIFAPCANAGEAKSAAAIMVGARRTNTRVMSSPSVRFHFLECVGVGLAGADARGVFQAEHEDFSVADLSGAGRGRERFHDAAHLVDVDSNLEPTLGKAINRVFCTEIDIGVSIAP